MTVADQARAAFAAARAEVAAGWRDPHLADILVVHGRASALPSVDAFARDCADRLDALSIEANLGANLPQLRRWDGAGNRVEQVVLHPATVAVGDAAWGAGILADWAEGRTLDALAKTYLLAQSGEAGQCCPIACTAGMIRMLQHTGAAVPAAWVERLASGAPAGEGTGRLWASQFLTEVQGGSDVGANALEARTDADGRVTLHGEKWFCSVVDAPLWLVTARSAGAAAGTAGLGAYVVERTRGGRPNGFSVRRLKDKLGTRSMASAELDLDGAFAVCVGGFKDVVEGVLNTSRVFNSVCCAAFMERARREATAYARHRRAFGRPIAEHPAIARVLARMAAETFGARSLSLRLAAWSPEGPDEGAAWRMLVNLCKTWTARACPAVVRDAIEVLGGNGAIEDFSVLPRLLRDSIVLEAWEGGHGVLAAQVWRDAGKGMLAPLFRTLQGWAGDATGDAADATSLHARLGLCRARWEAALAGTDGVTHAADLIEELRPLALAASLQAESRAGAQVAAVTVAAEHLLVIGARGWDPLGDPELPARVAVLARIV